MSSEYETLQAQLDRTRIYLVGSNEWTEMMTALYVAADRCLSISSDNASVLIILMHSEIEAFKTNCGPYGDLIAIREQQYEYGEDFVSGDNLVEAQP